MRRYTAADHEQFVAEQEARERKEPMERQERSEKAAALRARVAAGGSERAFNRQWERIRDEGRRR